MKKQLIMYLVGMMLSVSMFAEKNVLDFTAFKEVPKNIHPYGSNKPTLSIVDANGKKAVQSKVNRTMTGRSYGGMAIYLKTRIPWDHFDTIKLTVVNLDETVKGIVCVVYDEFNNVWQTSVPASFNELYTFEKDALKYTYTARKPKAPKPEAKIGKIKLVVFSMALKKGELKDFCLIIPRVEFAKKQK
jgi:hypothetical protein